MVYVVYIVLISSKCLSLLSLQINDTIKEEIMSNQRLLPAGKNLMAINGAILNIETIDLFS